MTFLYPQFEMRRVHSSIIVRTIRKQRFIHSGRNYCFPYYYYPSYDAFTFYLHKMKASIKLISFKTHQAHTKIQSMLHLKMQYKDDTAHSQVFFTTSRKINEV